MSSPAHSTPKASKPLPYELLVMYRQRSGLTQLQLAGLLGLKGERMVQLWEGGYSLPIAARLKKLIEIYLKQQVFVSGREQAEAWDLWRTVKNMTDANSANYETYPIFDEGWFASLLQSLEKGASTGNEPVASARVASSPEKEPESKGVPGERAVSVTHNLPVPANPFIGRTRDREAVSDLVRQGALRLVTLTGPGGIGKTRLALEVASPLVAIFPDGVWLVELAPHSDPRLVPGLVAKALDLREEPGQSPEQVLVDYLKATDLLLVLDNCEHLAEACGGLAGELLRACPRLRILATSREALGLACECLWQVEPLLVELTPPASAQDSAQQSEAVRLFLARARAIYPAFAPGGAELFAIGQICTLLEGIPLAIELAAARVKVLSVGQILERLSGSFEERFGLLGGGSRHTLPRHQTLKASLEWSYHLLPEEERWLFRRLSVFAGSWSLEAVEAVGGPKVLDPLVRLVDKSLVVGRVEQPRGGREKAGTNRYRMLETVRAYALGKLQEAGELAAAREAHLDFFVKMAEEIEPESQAGGPEWLPRLEAEFPNIRAALDWALGREVAALAEGSPTPGAESAHKTLRISSALRLFWNEDEHTTEGREWLAKAFQACPILSASRRDRAKALQVMGTLAVLQGEPGTGLKYLEESLGLYRELQDKREVANLLKALGEGAFLQGANQRSSPLFEEALNLYRELGDPAGISYSLAGLGSSSIYLGKYDRAATCLEEALALHRAQSHRQNSSICLFQLGVLAWAQGDLVVARERLEEALALQKGLGSNLGASGSLLLLGMVAWSKGDNGQAVTLVEESRALLDNWRSTFNAGGFPLYLGMAFMDQGDYGRAREHLQESVDLCKKTGDLRGLPLAMEGQAFLFIRLAEPERAAQLLGAAEALRERLHYPIFPVLKERYGREEGTLQNQLGRKKFDREWEKGRVSTSVNELDDS